MKILIVDDELVSRMKLQKIMGIIGECQAVNNGHDAIAAFEEAWENGEPFDLIMLDIAMPEMDGTEVLSEIREIEKEKKVPREKRTKIMMVTAYSDKESVITCVQTGCDDYISKPFDRQIIVEKLGNMFGDSLKNFLKLLSWE
jgi:two-component system chemotaxis response regulator CheY